MAITNEPIMLDETGRAIVEALTQKDVTQQRINEIKAATDEQLSRIPEVTLLQTSVEKMENDIGNLDSLTTNEKVNLVSAINEINRPTYTKEEVDNLVTLMLKNGSDYIETMRAWYSINGAEFMEDLSSLCERWHMIARIGWTGGTRFVQPDKSTASIGEKIGDNIGLVCEPSTDTVKGRDDYAGIPLFAVNDCNWELDKAGKRHITAIKGITSIKPFVTNDPTRPVGVLQMAPWCKYEEDQDHYTYWFSDQMYTDGFYPIPESVDLDGTIHTWVVHAKYGLGEACSSIADVPLLVWTISNNSLNSMIPEAFEGNKRYCGKCSCDDSWLKLHVYIKYASLTLDNIMNGCSDYFYTKHPAVAETDTKRLIMSVIDGNRLMVGATCCLGTTSYGPKDGQVSVVNSKRIVSIEDIEIDGTTYKAVYLDVDSVFDTNVNLFCTVMPWYTGTTDTVQGNDGSPNSNISGRTPYKLQGIECAYGNLEIIADTIFHNVKLNDTNVLTSSVCRDAVQFSTFMTDAYKKLKYSLPLATEGTQHWLKKLGHDPSFPEVMTGCLENGSSSTYTKDVALINASANYPMVWLSGGTLGNGIQIAGLSSANISDRLTGIGWSYGGRLSPNGSRGEYRMVKQGE